TLSGERPSPNLQHILLQFGLLEPLANFAWIKHQELSVKEATDSGDTLAAGGATTSNEETLYRFRHEIIQDYLISKHLETSPKEEVAKFLQSIANNDLAPRKIWSRKLHNIAVFYLHVKQLDSESPALKNLLTRIAEACTEEKEVLAEKKEKRPSLKETKVQGTIKSDEQRLIRRAIRGLKMPGLKGTDASFRILLESAYSIKGSHNDSTMLMALLKALPAKLMVGFQEAPFSDRIIRGLSTLIAYQAEINQNKTRREMTSCEFIVCE
ncbi:hypothetical protein Ciccas_012226, partial [Cichlidogyrus casuarinus]